jgi:hypothetical protein
MSQISSVNFRNYRRGNLLSKHFSDAWNNDPWSEVRPKFLKLATEYTAIEGGIQILIDALTPWSALEIGRDAVNP